MSTPQAVESDILGTESQRAVNAWDQLLRLQTDTFLPFELEYFLSSSSWARARSVLDIGCGNGYYLRQLQSFFPGKSYLGVDVSPQLIDAARSAGTHDGLDFERGDFFSYRTAEPFDVILMRLIVQHLSGFNSVLEKAASLLMPGGALFVIEPDVENSRNYPGTPAFDRVVREFEDHRDRCDKNRKRLGEFARIVARDPEWRLARDVRLTVPSVGPFWGTDYLEMMLIWIDLMERSGCRSQFDAAREELKRWSENRASFSQIGIRVLQIKHVNVPQQIH